MKPKVLQPDIDFIGGLGPLTESEESTLSVFFKSKKTIPAKGERKIGSTSKKGTGSKGVLIHP